MRSWIALAVLLLGGAAQAEARRFGLIIGHNGSLDADNPVLRYADDDALRMYEVLRTVADPADLRLLAEPDADTRRLFGEVPARSPTHGRLDEAVAALRARIQAAQAAGQRTEVYVFYGGHGDLAEGQGFVELADGPLTARALERRVLRPLAADRVHLLIDACNAFFMLSPRRPGGRRYTLQPERVLDFFARNPRVGVVLSTSTATEVFEWSELQSGIFSHELRSGLLGAADVDGDQVVSYAELDGFVKVANAGLVNARYRPRIFVRPPANATDAPLIARRSGPHVRLDPALSGRLYVQDDRGLRAAETHKAAGTTITLALPGEGRRWSLTRVIGQGAGGAGQTRLIEHALNPTASGAWQPAAARPATVGGKGVADIFKRLFNAPFEASAVAPIHADRTQAPPAILVHDLSVGAGAESGHLDGLAVVPTIALGYRAALDRWSLGLCAQLALASDQQTAAIAYDFKRYGAALALRYDWPIGPLALTAGPTIGAAYEEQTYERPIVAAGGQASTSAGRSTTVSLLWGGAAGVEWPIGDALAIGVEGLAGARSLQIGGGLAHRAVFGAALLCHWHLN